jgi:hypothetical protein
MITINNISELLNKLTLEDLKPCFDSNKDFVLFEMHVFNVGAYVRIESKDYSEEEEEEAQSKGNVFCDKDTFLQMFKESDSTNPYLTKLTS